MQNTIDKSSSLGFWKRFYIVFTPKLMTYLRHESNNMSSYSWGFWFLSNTLFALVLMASIFFGGQHVLKIGPEKIEQLAATETIQINETSTPVIDLLTKGSITITKQAIEVNNIPDPLVLSMDQQKDLLFSTNIPKDQTIIGVLDTNNTLKFNSQTFAEQNKGHGVFIQKDQVDIWNAAENTLQSIKAKDLPEDINLPQTLDWNLIKNNTTFLMPIVTALAITLGILFWIFIALFRLINMLFWSTVFNILFLILPGKSISFIKTFEALLHFGFITFPLAFVGLVVFQSHFWWNLAIFGCLFGMNLWYDNN